MDTISDPYSVPGHDCLNLRLEFTESLLRRPAKANWAKHLGYLSRRPTSYLEIGIFEGHTFCWVIRNLLQHPDSRACGIDAWDATLPGIGSEHIKPPGVIQAAEERARRNAMKCDPAAVLVRTRSLPWLSQAVADGKKYDLIYVDGSHGLVDMWLDTGLAWLLLAEGGVLVWDDYNGQIAKAANLFVEMVGASVVWRQRIRQLAVRKHIDG